MLQCELMLTLKTIFSHFNTLKLYQIILEEFSSVFFLFHVELVHKASKDDSRDFLFYLAVAYYRLKVSTFIQSRSTDFKSSTCV